MERTKLLTLAVIGLLLLNLLTIGYLVVKPNQITQIDRHEGPFPAGRGPARVIIKRLHFDEQQEHQYMELVQQHRRQTEQLNTESIQLFQTYYDLLTATQPDSTKAETITRQIADVQRQLAELNFDHFQQIKALCRPDQQADFARLVTDLTRLFGQPQRPPHHPSDGPPDGLPNDRLGGPPAPGN